MRPRFSMMEPCNTGSLSLRAFAPQTHQGSALGAMRIISNQPGRVDHLVHLPVLGAHAVEAGQPGIRAGDSG
jgi:hypothetical protein